MRSMNRYRTIMSVISAVADQTALNRLNCDFVYHGFVNSVKTLVHYVDITKTKLA